ncbi:acyl carrier protein [Lactobacillus helveticus]|uniref:acyl carrier protein n=1 Tax=Lactobacillus helveticus TaxID=1587 RepID=UPI002181F789|nr:phosphopantetheine-binding protein [Lactobacillus helveticus]MCT0192023.1 acyl carrier protein [Lactobacillus helveticus]
MKNNSQKFIKFLHNDMKIPKNRKISNNDSLIDDLGFDSLDRMDIVYFIESTTNKELKEDIIEKINTVKDVVDYLDKCDKRE